MREAHFPQNKLNFCAASPREYPAKEGEDSENQTRSETNRCMTSQQCIGLVLLSSRGVYSELWTESVLILEVLSQGQKENRITVHNPALQYAIVL